MRRIALSLSIVASLALLDACSGGSQGTGFSNTSSPSASINKIAFVNPATGTVSNVFIAAGTAVATPTPTPTPTPAGQTPTPAPTPTPMGSPTVAPSTTPSPTPSPTPKFTVVTPAPPGAGGPGEGASPVQPVLIEGLGYNNGGGILGSISVPSVTFRWTAFYTPKGTTVNYQNNGSSNTETCGAPPDVPGSGAPIQIDYQFAPTTSNPVPSNGDTLDPLHPGYARAALNSNDQTVNYYNPIAFFPPQIVNGTYCITLLATASNGVQGTATVVVIKQ
jgi:hypothetical protein